LHPRAEKCKTPSLDHMKGILEELAADIFETGTISRVPRFVGEVMIRAAGEKWMHGARCFSGEKSGCRIATHPVGGNPQGDPARFRPGVPAGKARKACEPR